MRINITNCATEKPTRDKDFCLSFDSDIISHAVDNKVFAKQLASSLRDFANLLESTSTADKTLF